MTRYRRINTTTLKKLPSTKLFAATVFASGTDVVIKAPPGQAYVPVDERPTAPAGKKTKQVISATKISWELVDMTPEEIAIANRVIWPSGYEFLQMFTVEEQTAIATNPATAALGIQLAGWPGEVWSDDPRILAGLDALVAASIITAERKAQIIAPVV